MRFGRGTRQPSGSGRSRKGTGVDRQQPDVRGRHADPRSVRTGRYTLLIGDDLAAPPVGVGLPVRGRGRRHATLPDRASVHARCGAWRRACSPRRVVLRVGDRELRPSLVEPALQAQPQLFGDSGPIAQDIVPLSRIGLQVIQLVVTVLVVVNQLPGATSDYR